VCPSSCLLSPEFLSLLLVLLRHGHKVPSYKFCASYFLHLLRVHLPFYNLVIRPYGMIPFQNRSFSERLVGQVQVLNAFAIAVIPRPLVSGSVVISKYQPVVVIISFPACVFPRPCATRVPALPVDFEISRQHRAASPLPEYFLPVWSPLMSLSCLHATIIMNVYVLYNILSFPSDVNINYVVARVVAQVGSFFLCKARISCAPQSTTFSFV